MVVACTNIGDWILTIQRPCLAWKGGRERREEMLAEKMRNSRGQKEDMFPRDLTYTCKVCPTTSNDNAFRHDKGTPLFHTPTLTPSMSFLCVFYHKAAKELRASYCFGKGLNWILKLSFYLWYGGLIWLDIWMFTASACFAVFGIVVCSIYIYTLIHSSLNTEYNLSRKVRY